MTVIRILEIVMWIIAGIVVLNLKNADVRYMKMEYAIIWVVLLIKLASELAKK